MARTFVLPPSYRFLAAKTNDEVFLEMRDAIRAALDPDNLHTNWVVSDVTKWTGYLSDVGHAFVVYHRSGGSNTGPSFMFIGGWRRALFLLSNTGSVNDSSINASLTYIQGDSGTNQWYGIQYCATGGTSTPPGGGWDTLGTLSGGDLSAPAVNPYGSWETFRNSTFPLLGAAINTFMDLAFVFDDSKPFLTLYTKYGLVPDVNFIMILGEIITPYLSTDVNTHGVLGWDVGSYVNQGGQVQVNVSYAISPVGTLRNYTNTHHTLYTKYNDKVPGGEYSWDVVSLVHPDNFKGYIDSDIVRLLGAYGHDMARLYDGGNFIKVIEGFVTPFVPGQPPFPGG
jgi:hypothetical protein